MAEVTSTLEERKHCPKCSAVGVIKRKDRRMAGDVVYTIVCQNKVCPWYETGWTVQADSQGIVKERNHSRIKEFTAYTDAQRTAAQHIIDQAKGN